MNTLPLARCFPSAIVTACLLVLPAHSTRAADAADTLKKNFTVQDGGRLTIRADRGSIDITTSATGQVDIEVQREAKGSRGEEVLKKHVVTFTQSGNDVKIEARLPKDLLSGWRSPNLNVRYRVAVPRVYHVDLETAGGSVQVQALDGEARAQTAGGSITFAEIKGKAQAETAGGSIKVGGCGGTLKAETAGGSIRVERCAGAAEVSTAGGNIDLGEMAGAVTASTAGGSIKIRSAKAELKAETAGGGITVEQASGGVQAETSAGSITVGFPDGLVKDSKLETAGGAITVTLPENAALEIDAEAAGGRVVSDLPVTVQGETRRGELHGKINGGGRHLQLSTTAGSINIRKK